jgi:hypothetical protein
MIRYGYTQPARPDLGVHGDSSCRLEVGVCEDETVRGRNQLLVVVDLGLHHRVLAEEPSRLGNARGVSHYSYVLTVSPKLSQR